MQKERENLVAQKFKVSSGEADPLTHPLVTVGSRPKEEEERRGPWTVA
jgi:hypothetical protein